jgi:predicted GNAT superfamily acetyltransferase
MSSHARIDGLTSHAQVHPTPEALEIEELRGIAGAQEVEALQRKIWSADDAWIVPSHALLIVSEYGGVLLGARVGDDLAGFVLGFLARQDGTLFHASHMLGVLPTSQLRGIGAALKWRQRDAALAQGLDLMRWTFDPLESRNAYFNLHKLGAICATYRTDYYGPMQDGLNRDLPSDRLLVEWRLREPGVSQSRDAVRTILRDREGTPEMTIDGTLPDGPVGIQIPRDLQAIKRESPDLALAWRLAVRAAFIGAFAQGYVACDFRDGAYVLRPGKELLQ